jgi:hypothetical protein
MSNIVGDMAILAGLDISDLEKDAIKAQKVIKQMDDKLLAFNRTFSQQPKGGLWIAGQEQAQAINNTTKAVGGYNQGLVQTGFLLDDAQQFQYGFSQGLRATSNNLIPVIQGLGLSASTLGWVAVSVGAATLAYTIFQDELHGTAVGVAELNDAFDELVDIDITGGFDAFTVKAEQIPALLASIREDIADLKEEAAESGAGDSVFNPASGMMEGGANPVLGWYERTFGDASQAQDILDSLEGPLKDAETKLEAMQIIQRKLEELGLVGKSDEQTDQEKEDEREAKRQAAKVRRDAERLVKLYEQGLKDISSAKNSFIEELRIKTNILDPELFDEAEKELQDTLDLLERVNDEQARRVANAAMAPQDVILEDDLAEMNAEWAEMGHLVTDNEERLLNMISPLANMDAMLANALINADSLTDAFANFKQVGVNALKGIVAEAIKAIVKMTILRGLLQLATGPLGLSSSLVRPLLGFTSTFTDPVAATGAAASAVGNIAASIGVLDSGDLALSANLGNADADYYGVGG